MLEMLILYLDVFYMLILAEDLNYFIIKRMLACFYIIFIKQSALFVTILFYI